MYEVGKLYVDRMWSDHVFMIVKKKQVKLVSMGDIEYTYYYLCNPNKMNYAVDSIVRGCWEEVK